jgi:hypothetical protein
MLRRFADSKTLIRRAIAGIVVVTLVASVVFADHCDLLPAATNCASGCAETTFGQVKFCIWEVGYEYIGCVDELDGCWCEETFSNEITLRTCKMLRRQLTQGHQCTEEGYCQNGNIYGYRGLLVPNECTHGCY